MSHSDQASKRTKTIFSFFKPREGDKARVDEPSTTTSTPNVDAPRIEPNVVDAPRIEPNVVDVIDTPSVERFERDPGLRLQIWQHPVNQRDEVRRTYLKQGAYQPFLEKYPRSESGKQFRSFQNSWFKRYSWLEYSIAKDRVYCLPCFIFADDSPKHATFTIDGFNSWKRVNCGEKCAFVQHMGDGSSIHMSAVQSCEALMNPLQHIDRVMNAQSKEMVEKNRLRLKATIETVRVLALQACAFRGHDESIQSSNRGNFIQFVKYSARLSDKIAEVVLENAPKNAKYTSPMIQKEILHILADKVRNKIREEVGNAKFCILVDEAQDESNKEQMAIVLRFVDDDGFIRERFFEIVGVEDTTALTLKNEISIVLSRYSLSIENIRGQGYDGASNMRGAWNGLQALFLKECPYAYYVHCFAHRLQLALVAASKDVDDIWLFFSMLNNVVNQVGASPKRHTELQSTQAEEISRKIADGELETGRGLNQVSTLQRAGPTRWSSHFNSVSSLIDMYGATCIVLDGTRKNGLSQSIRAQAKGAYNGIREFKFVFILHLLQGVMGITEVLCQAVQQKCQDIVNAMGLVSTTKTLLQEMRQDGWDSFLQTVVLFCNEHNIVIPDMTARHMMGTGRSCQQEDCITFEHHYRIDIFNAAIDFQIVELNSRFTEGAMELLIFSSAFNPKDGYKSFNIDSLCTLAEKYYPQDFMKHEIIILRGQLKHYGIDVPRHPDFQNLSTISELCQKLVATGKSKPYNLVDRLIRLVLTLPVSTATTERAFSAMKLVKTALRNKMEDEFLGDCMTVHIERDIADNIDADSIIDDFNRMKDRRAHL